jgi:4-hydroxy-2-oxoheptanedioate aldolase
MTTNPIRMALAEGRPSLGSWSSLGNPLAAEIQGRAGFDWIVLDAQHGAVNDGNAVMLIHALAVGGTPALMRVAWNDPPTIMHALDLGVLGIIVPMVNDRAAAESAARASRYPPLGERSFGPIRNRYASPSEANDDIVCLAMIETAAALANIDDIVSRPGIDGAFIGPVDLALSLRGELDTTGANDHVLDAIDVVVNTCRRHGKIAGTLSSNQEQAATFLARGIDFLSFAGDLGAVRTGVNAAADVVATLRNGASR